MFLSKIFKFTRGKALIAFAGLAMVLGVTGAISTVAAMQQNEVVETKATDLPGYWNVCIQGRRTSGGEWVTFSTTKSADADQIEYTNFACVSGFEFLGYYDKDNHGNWIKQFQNNATGSTWDNNGGDGNARCQTDGVYSLYFKPSDGKTYISYGVITVNLNYVDGSGEALKEATSVTTTSQNDYSAPAIPSIYGYTTPTTWKIGSTSGSDYSATRLTETTLNLYAVYSAASTKTVYFDAGSDYGSYETPYIYAFSENGRNAAWPGVTMTKASTTKKSIYGGFVWYASVPENCTVIFSPGGDSGKTDDLPLASVGNGSVYLLYGIGVGNWQTTVNLSVTNQDTSTTTNYYVYSGVDFTLPSLSKTGYTAKWNTRSDGEGTDYTPGGTTSTTSALTLYSKFIINTYTITFNQNDASGGYFTASKTHGVAFTIPAPGESPISEMGPSGGRYFIRWDTNSGGTGTSYAAGASYTTDEPLTLHMIQGWYTYWYSLDGGDNWTQMVVDNTDKPAQYDYQHRSASIPLTGGDTITFCRTKTTTFSDAEAVSINAWQNNVNSSGVITYTTNGKIYLKINREGNPDVYVEGSLTLRWIAVNGSKCTMSYTDANSDWYTSTAISLHPGDQVQAGYSNEDPYNLSIQSGDGSFTIDGTIVCEAPGVFVIHLLSDDGGFHFDEANFVMDAAASAVLFAQTFNSDISDVCTDIVEEGAAVTSLSTPWGTQATYYASLTSDAQTAVKSGSSDSNVIACRTKYDYVCGKYGPNGQKITGVTDFMGRNPSKPASASVIPGSANEQSPLTLTLWIVLGAGILGMGAIGTAYFVSKKKKRHQA